MDTGRWLITRLRRRGPVIVDAGLAALIATVGAIELALLEPAWLWGCVLAISAALAFAVRRRRPVLLVVWLIALQATLQGGAEAEPAFYYVLGLVAAFSVTAYSARATAGAGALAIIASYAIYTARSEAPESSLGDLITGCVFLAVAAALGFAFGHSRRRAERLQVRTARLVSAREAEARAAVAEERGRIARELHDAVAHNVSVMTLQAGAVRRRLDERHARERDVLHALERSGRESVAELRRIVGILRDDGSGSGADRSPPPSIRDLGALVQEVVDAGIAVELRAHTRELVLPIGIDSSAYRVVQEALTNVVKHAPGAQAEVVVRIDGRNLAVEVSDDGGPTGPGNGSGPGLPGHGLIGMRERVTFFGGELRAGPKAGGGFAVQARFPLPPAGG